MKDSARNMVVWTGVAAILAAVWYFGARPRLHFINPAGFLALLVVAALALACLLWWEIATADENHRQDATGGSTPPATGEES